MARTTVSRGLTEHLAEMIHVPEEIDTLKERYQSADPYPHLILNNLFSNDLLRQVSDEIPPLGTDRWIHHDDAHQNKFGLKSAMSLGPKGTQLTAILHSTAFLYFLSEVTNIWGLLPDPYLQGAGFHVLPIGAKFDVHIDRKTDYVTGLQRRLALIVYLNDDWKHEYGGQLELWDKEGKACKVSIEPTLNTTALFEVADGNYHGNPNPIACPPGRTRNSLIVYYHTVPGEGDARSDLLSSVFAPSFYEKRFRLRTFLRDWTPPAIFRALNRARTKK